MKDLILTALTRDDLEAFFDHRLDLAFQRHSEKVPRHPDTAPGQAAPPYVSKKEAARLLGVCASSVDNAARRGDLTRNYVGKAVRFDRAQVLNLAKSHTNHKQKK
jgi:hypothetical protein